MKKYVFLFFSLCIFSSISPHVVRLSKIASWHELKDFQGALGISQPIKYYHIVTDVLPPADKVITFTAQDLIDIKKNQESMMPKVPWKDYVSPQSKEFCSLIQSNQRVSVLLKMPDSRDDVHLEVQSKVDKKKAILKSKIIKIRSLVENFNPDLIRFMRGAFLELDSLWIAYSVIFFGVGSLVCQMIKNRRDFAREQEEKSWYTYYIFSEADEEFKNLYRHPGAVRYYRSRNPANSRKTKDYQEYLDGVARYKRAKEEYILKVEYILKEEAAERKLKEAKEEQEREWREQLKRSNERLEREKAQAESDKARRERARSRRHPRLEANPLFVLVDGKYSLTRARCSSVKTLYDILCLRQDCDSSQIRMAYRNLALKFHPDKFDKNFPDEVEKKAFYAECFKAIAAANNILSDDEQKSNYDLSRDVSSDLDKMTRESMAPIIALLPEDLPVQQTQPVRPSASGGCTIS